MSQTIYDCLIVGGGISGISFAHYLSRQGKKVLILEQNEKIGGQIQSPASTTDAAYWRELGAHTCYNSYTNLLSIVKELGVENQLQALGKGSWMIYEKKVASPMVHINFLSLMLNGPKLFFSKRDGKTVQEYFQNIVGRGNYQKLFTHMFHAVLSQNADNYPAEIFLKRRAGRMEEFPRKFTFSHGMKTILDLMIDKNDLKIETSATVVEVSKDVETSIYTLRTEEGEAYQADNVAFACNPQEVAKLIYEQEAELAELLNTIPTFYTESMNIVVPKSRLKLKPVAGVISVVEDFYSTVSRDLVDDTNLRSFTFHFGKDEKKLAQKIALAREVLDIEDEADILEVCEISHALPSLRMQHLGMAQQVERVKKDDNLYLLGNYFYGLSLEDCVNRSKDEADRFLS